MCDELQICGTCRDYRRKTTESGKCDVADQQVFAGDVKPCWRSRRGNVIVTALVMAATALGIGALLAGIWSAAVAGR